MNKDIEAMVRYRDEVTSSKEKAIIALQKAGIMDEEGEIVELYREVLCNNDEEGEDGV